MKVEVAVLGSPSIIVLKASVDEKLHGVKLEVASPRLPVLHSPYGLCGCKEILN